MAKATVVAPDIALGEQVLSLWDAANFPVTAALWLLDDESERWKFIASTAVYDKEGPGEAYLRANAIISGKIPISLFEFDKRLTGNRDPLIKALRKHFSSRPVAGKRFGWCSIDGIWIPDAYLYRLKK